MLMVEDVDLTPNPHALKFILNQKLLNYETRQYHDKESAKDDPFASGIFQLDGVVSVFYMDKFVTIEKSPESNWGQIQRPFIEFLKAFDANLIPAETVKAPTAEEENELLKRINYLLDQKARPALAGDGGGLQVLGIDGFTVKIRYQGACGSCPSSISGTLIAIEGLLRRDVNPSNPGNCCLNKNFYFSREEIRYCFFPFFYLPKTIMTNQIYYASDIINGITLDVIVSEKGIREILINKKPESDTLTRATQVAPEEQSMKKIFRQLKEYFNRERREFELSLEIIGTDFQKKVWDELTKIPYGETISYGELAVRLGDKNKMRAVAAANGANPIPVIIPCHRVIGADGSLTGYGGGLDVKKKLLELEGRWTMDLFIPS